MSTSIPARAAATPGRCRRAASAWVAFWFTPADPVGLHVLRFLAGLLFLVWLLPFAGSVTAFFSLQGWFDQQAYAELARLSEGTPFSTSWSILFLCGGNPTLLNVVYWLSVAVLGLFALGIAPRITSVLTWLVVISFAANPAMEYEADALLGIIAFYLMLGHLLEAGRRPGQSWLGWLVDSRTSWLLARGTPAASLPSVGANLAIRLLQVHFAIVVVASGLHKLQFGDWWAGVALWYPLFPPLQTTLAQARSFAGSGIPFLFALSIIAYGMLGWQLTFPWFAWQPGWRPVLLGGAVLGWVGLAFVYDLPWLGPIYALGCLSYVSAEEWRSLQARLFRWMAGPDPEERPIAEQPTPATPSLSPAKSHPVATMGPQA